MINKTYAFGDRDLELIFLAWSRSCERGPSAAFRWWHQLEEGAWIDTSDVEDFAIAFMTQYNQKFPRTF